MFSLWPKKTLIKQTVNRMPLDEIAVIDNKNENRSLVALQTFSCADQSNTKTLKQHSARVSGQTLDDWSTWTSLS